MINSITYVVCCNKLCKESGNIKKNTNKCIECKKLLNTLNLDVLNTYFCIDSKNCTTIDCKLIHPNKQHHSPPFISPCINGIGCENNNCLFLHPNRFGVWLS